MLPWCVFVNFYMDDPKKYFGLLIRLKCICCRQRQQQQQPTCQVSVSYISTYSPKLFPSPNFRNVQFPHQSKPPLMQCSKKMCFKNRETVNMPEKQRTKRRHGEGERKQVCDPHRAKTDDGNQSLAIRVEVEWRDKGGEFVVAVEGCGGWRGEEKEPAQQYGSIALGK